MSDRSYLREILRWSPGEKGEWPALLAAACGMVVPVLIGAWAGHLRLGLIAAVGAMLAGGAVGNNGRRPAGDLFLVFLTVNAAALAATAVAGHSWKTWAGLVAFSAVAALIGGYSRATAVTTQRFIVFMMIVESAASGGQRGAVSLALVGLGALLNILLALLFGLAAKRRDEIEPEPGASGPNPTRQQKFARWLRMMRKLEGWQYASRISVCLVAAGLYDMARPHHHATWIALTVALLIQRRIEILSIKAAQRALGVAIGVVIAGFLIAGSPSRASSVGVIVALAAIRPWLRQRNYLAYSATMTPLIILLMDLDEPPNIGVLGDRMVATIIGVGLVAATNLVFARLIPSAIVPR